MFVFLIKYNHNDAKYGKHSRAEAIQLHPNIPWVPSGHDVLALCLLHATGLCRHLLMYTGAWKPNDTPLLELSDGEGKLNLRQLQMQGNITNSSQVSNDSSSQRYLFNHVKLEWVPAVTVGMSCEVWRSHWALCWHAKTEWFARLFYRAY